MRSQRAKRSTTIERPFTSAVCAVWLMKMWTKRNNTSFNLAF